MDIQAIVDGDISVSLYLGGKAQDVKVIAEVLATLLEVGHLLSETCSRPTPVTLDGCPCSWSRRGSLHFR